MLFWVLEVIAVLGFGLAAYNCYKISKSSLKWGLTITTCVVFLALLIGCVFIQSVNTTSFVAFDVWTLALILMAVRKTDKSCM